MEEALESPFLNPYATNTWQHPVRLIHSAWGSTKKAERAAFPVEKIKESISSFLTNVELCGQQCRDLHNRALLVKSCRGCLRHHYNSFLSSYALERGTSFLRRVVEALYDFAMMSKKEQDLCLIEYIRYSHACAKKFDGILSIEEKMQTYLMPGSNQNWICKNALAHLLGIGKDRWMKLAKAMKHGIPDQLITKHGLEGKRSNNYNPHFEILLEDFFERIKLFAVPRATRFVRSENADGKVQVELRDTEEELMELPSCYSKRSLYNRLVQECGWTLRTDGKGREIIIPSKKEGIDEAPFDCPSWFKFWQYWNIKHPNLIITKPSEDICSDCFIFANQHKHCQQLTSSTKESDNEDETDAAITAMKKQEQLILKAAEHVRAADLQRLLFQKKTEEAIATRNNKPEERVYCFVADYSQSLYLPNFACEQPGETYYYSPLNYNAFGIVDCSKTPTELACYVYHEGEGKKGGNNVASMLFAELKRQQLVSDDSSGTALAKAKEINFVFDNCSGQNKNRMVLRFLVWCVARGICETARAIFLVCGHTKNHCDRMFNLLKQTYRKSNVYIPSDLVKCIGKQQNITVIEYEQIQFFDWDEAFEKYLGRLNATLVNHIFEIEECNPTTMKTQLYVGKEVKTQHQLLKPQHRESEWYNNLQLKQLKEPGLQDIKKIELYDKWRLLIPFAKRKLWKYYRDAPPLSIRNKVSNHTKQSKKQRTDRSRTANFDNSDVV